MPGAPLGAHAAQLREAGDLFLATRQAHQLAHRALVEAVAAALDDGVHYLDVAGAAGVSKRLPYRLAHASAAAGDKLTA